MNAPDDSLPVDPEYADRIRVSFGRQKAMTLIGARLTRVAPGATEVALPYRDDLTQQKGFVHGGIIGMMLPDTPDTPE